MRPPRQQRQLLSCTRPSVAQKRHWRLPDRTSPPPPRGLRYTHAVEDLQGTVTGALRGAQMSTVARVRQLEGQVRAQLKDIGKLKRSMAEQRKHEAHVIEVGGGRAPWCMKL